MKKSRFGTPENAPAILKKKLFFVFRSLLNTLTLVEFYPFMFNTYSFFPLFQYGFVFLFFCVQQIRKYGKRFGIDANKDV